MIPRFKVRDAVFDRDGFPGTITKITFHDDGHWYDVRLPGGEAVRFETDLSPAVVTVPELEPHCGSWVVVDVRDPAAPVPLCECYVRATVDRLAELAIPGRIEILTAARWLGWCNRAIKLAGGVQPGPQHWIAARPPVDGSSVA